MRSPGVYLVFTIMVLLLGCTPRADIKSAPVTPSRAPEQGQSASDESTPPRQAKLSAVDELSIYVRPDYSPLMFLDAEGRPTGFLVDLENAACAEMGQKSGHVPWTDAQKAIQDVKVGRVYGISGVPATEDYRKLFTVSDAEIRIDAVTFVHRDTTGIGGSTMEETVKSLFGKRVGVQTRDAIYEILRNYPEVKIVEYKTGTEALEALARKEVDAKIEMKELTLYYAKRNKWPIKAVGAPIFSAEVCTGFYKGLDPDVVARFNAALKKIKDNGTYQKIYDKWFK